MWLNWERVSELPFLAFHRLNLARGTGSQPHRHQHFEYFHFTGASSCIFFQCTLPSIRYVGMLSFPLNQPLRRRRLLFWNAKLHESRKTPQIYACIPLVFSGLITSVRRRRSISPHFNLNFLVAIICPNINIWTRQSYKMILDQYASPGFQKQFWVRINMHIRIIVLFAF